MFQFWRELTSNEHCAVSRAKIEFGVNMGLHIKYSLLPYLPYQRLHIQQTGTNKRMSGVPNQSLKLTEPAVGDFTARCWTNLDHLTVTSAQRTALRWQFAAAA